MVVEAYCEQRNLKRNRKEMSIEHQNNIHKVFVDYMHLNSIQSEICIVYREKKWLEQSISNPNTDHFIIIIHKL